VYPRFHEDAEVPWLRASVRELKARGCCVTVVAPSHRGIKSHSIDGAPVYRFRYAPKNLEMLTHDEGAPSKMARNPFLQLLAIPYIISGSLKTLLLCWKLKPDILHVHWPFPHAFLAYFARIFYKAPVVLTFYGAELLLAKKKKWIRPILKAFIKRADAAVAISGFTASEVRKIFDRGDIAVIPYGTTLHSKSGNAGVDGNRPASEQAGDGKFRILFVGRHIERKGIEYLIEAAATLDPGKFQVRIVGQGDLTEKLKELAAKIAPDQVIFTGKLSAEELENEYKSAGCFAMPSIVDSRGDTEGLGVVLIEAAEFGVPVIASDLGGITDIVINGETGLLVKEKSPPELADAIMKLYNDEPLRKKLADGCKKRVNEFFSWDRIAAEQIALYKALIK
jgi:glycosyltransferase involved in cell wall biosynthesis